MHFDEVKDEINFFKFIIIIINYNYMSLIYK
jgi:hypothetical protein